MHFAGYSRADGNAGARNHLAVVASVSCANAVVDGVARAVPGVKAITHTEGCGRGPIDVINTARTLVGITRNPNLGALIVVGLGCEFIKAPMVSREAAASKKPIETFVIQENGGSQQTLRKVTETAAGLMASLSGQQRVETPWSRFVLGIDCSGTDLATALRVNPVLGYCADWIIEQGGRVLLADLRSMAGGDGGEDLVAGPEVAAKLRAAAEGRRGVALQMLGDAITPELPPAGTLLRSLRMRAKLADIVDNDGLVSHAGLSAMDTPSSPVYAITGLAAGGAQVILQTAQRGIPGGFPTVPVIKIATSRETYQAMEDDLDFDAGGAIDLDAIPELGQALLGRIAAVASGASTKAEDNDYDLMAMHTYGPAF